MLDSKKNHLEKKEAIIQLCKQILCNQQLYQKYKNCDVFLSTGKKPNSSVSIFVSTCHFNGEVSLPRRYAAWLGGSLLAQEPSVDISWWRLDDGYSMLAIWEFLTLRKHQRCSASVEKKPNWQQSILKLSRTIMWPMQSIAGYSNSDNLILQLFGLTPSHSSIKVIKKSIPPVHSHLPWNWTCKWFTVQTCGLNMFELVWECLRYLHHFWGWGWLDLASKNSAMFWRGSKNPQISVTTRIQCFPAWWRASGSTKRHWNRGGTATAPQRRTYRSGGSLVHAGQPRPAGMIVWAKNSGSRELEFDIESSDCVFMSKVSGKIQSYNPVFSLMFLQGTRLLD